MEPGSGAAPSWRVLVIDDERLADRIREQWSTRGDGTLDVVKASREEMRERGRSLSSADVIVFPSLAIGDMVRSEFIVPFPDKTIRDENLGWTDLFDTLRHGEAEWDRRVLAIPFGSATPLLWYRRDLWKEEGTAAFETWDAFGAAMARWKERERAFPIACAEPLGRGWGGLMLLARAAAYAHHRSYLSALFHPDDMRPLIDGPPFVRALDELAAMPGAAASLECDPRTALDALASNRSLAAIGWWDARSERPSLPATADIAVVRLPGARLSFDRQRQAWDERPDGAERVSLIGFSGRLGAIGRKARSERASANLLVWLAGVEWSHEIVSASAATMPARGAPTASVARWLPPWAAEQAWVPDFTAALAETMRNPAFLAAPRVAGADAYLAALDEAVARVVRHEMASAESLGEAARQWQAITDRLGREPQRAAYRAGLGL